MALDLDRALQDAAASLAPAGFAANPFARLSLRKAGAGFDFAIEAPVPGEGLRRNVVQASQQPGLHQFLARLLLPGRASPGSAPLNELQSAGAIVPADAVPQPVMFDWPASDVPLGPAVANAPGARASLARDGFVELRALLSGDWLRRLRTYYSGLVAQGFLLASDEQSERYTAFDEPVARALHLRLAPVIAGVFPGPVTPTYCYLGLYRAGAALARHVDREACEYTVSLTIDAQPSAAREAAWPLCLDLPSGAVISSLLAPGDGLLFKGRDLPHYRHPLPAGRTSWSVFFHFVSLAPS